MLVEVPLGDSARRPWRGPPPRRLPLRLRTTLPQFLALNGAITAVVAWQWGWIALVIPLFVGFHLYRTLNAATEPPAWFRRWRRVIPPALVAMAALLAWETRLIQFVLPGALGIALFAGMLRAGWPDRRTAALAGVVAGAALYFGLGTGGKPLSPCRLLGADRAAEADAFTRGMLEGDLAGARKHAISSLASLLEPSDTRHLSAAKVAAAVDTQRGPMVCAYPLVGTLHDCFEYDVPETAAHPQSTFFAAVTCDGGQWRVRTYGG
jgi:hypothetical protein